MHVAFLPHCMAYHTDTTCLYIIIGKLPKLLGQARSINTPFRFLNRVFIGRHMNRVIFVNYLVLGSLTFAWIIAATVSVALYRLFA